MPNDVMTPEEYSQLLQLGGANQDLALKIKQQQDIADQLRVKNAPQGRMVGQVYAGPSWLETAGALARNYSAASQQQNAMGLQRQSNTNTQQQNRMIMEAILKGQRGGMGQGIMPGEQGGIPEDPYQRFRMGGGMI